MNQHIVVAVVVIAGVTLWHHFTFASVETSGPSVTSIGVGAFLFLGVLAVVDMVPGLDPIAGGLAMLAMLVVLLNDLPGLLDSLNWGPPTTPSAGKGPR